MSEPNPSPTQAADLEPVALAAFATAFGGRPTHLGRAPGRVELLGNHTDYNGGLVMAAAVDRETVVVGRPAAGRTARVYAADLGASDTFDLDAIAPEPQGHWANYARGVVKLLQERYGRADSGFELAIVGDVPRGAGLSSSASLQAALAGVLLGSGLIGGGRGMPDAGDDAGRFALAQTLQRSENAFVGVASGLLDQFSVLFGRQGHALSLDCTSLAFARVPMGRTPPALVVCDSKTSRQLADGMYNRRRAECETVVSHFQGLKGPGVQTLRDVTLAELEAEWDRLDPVGRRRARHVLTENARVIEGAEALTAGDLARFGALVSASHASSRDDFENSSPALDALAAAAAGSPGFLGGKLSGAGWAGCTINLVEPAQAPAFADAVAAGYLRRTGVSPDVHILHPAEGASGRDL